MPSKLRPCPFCGAIPDKGDVGSSANGNFLYCYNCGAAGPDWKFWLKGKDQGASNSSEARAAWNKRHADA